MAFRFNLSRFYFFDCIVYILLIQFTPVLKSLYWCPLSALIGTLAVVIRHKLIWVNLDLFDSAVELLAERNRVELIFDGLVQWTYPPLLCHLQLEILTDL